MDCENNLIYKPKIQSAMDEMGMEMPTPCQRCGQLFDLNDGRGSQKWYPDTVICESCWREEQEEIKEDERWENANNELADALFIFKEEGAWEKLTKENRALIRQLVEQRFVDEIDSVDYHAHAEGCGLEDRGIQDRYEAMKYGYERGIEAAIEAVKNAL